MSEKVEIELPLIVKESNQAKIQDHHDEKSNISSSQNHLIEDQEEFKASHMILEITKSSLPSMIQSFATALTVNASLHFLGQLNNTSLYAQFGFAFNIYLTLTFYPSINFSTGLTATCSQALGSKRYHLIADYYYKALTIHSIFQLIIFIFFCNCSAFFKFIGVEDSLANSAEEYLTSFGLLMFFFVITEVTKAFLYVYNHFIPQVLVQITICSCHWLLCNRMIQNYNEFGVIYSLTIGQILGMVLLLLYTFKFNEETSSLLIKNWPTFDSLTLGLWKYAKIMIGIGMMAYLEVLVFRLDYFFASFLAKEEFSALLSLGNIDDIFFILPIGIAIPMTTYVGKAIGQKNIPLIKNLLKIITIISTTLAMMVLFIYSIFKTQIQEFYTQDSQVLSILSSLTLVWMIGYPLDFAQAVLASILRAIGKEDYGTKSFFYVYYLLGFPLSMIFAFVLDWGVKGIWLGSVVGMYMVSASLFYVLYKANWKNQIQIIEDRLDETEKQ